MPQQLSACLLCPSTKQHQQVQCCIRCLSQGVNAAHIIDGRSKHSVLMELLTDEVSSVCVYTLDRWLLRSLLALKQCLY